MKNVLFNTIVLLFIFASCNNKPIVNNELVFQKDVDSLSLNDIIDIKHEIYNSILNNSNRDKENTNNVFSKDSFCMKYHNLIEIKYYLIEKVNSTFKTVVMEYTILETDNKNTLLNQISIIDKKNDIIYLFIFNREKIVAIQMLNKNFMPIYQFRLSQNTIDGNSNKILSIFFTYDNEGHYLNERLCSLESTKNGMFDYNTLLSNYKVDTSRSYKILTPNLLDGWGKNKYVDANVPMWFFANNYYYKEIDE